MSDMSEEKRDKTDSTDESKSRREKVEDGFKHGIGLLSAFKDALEETIQEAAEILPIESRVAEHFANIFARLRRAGRRIETNDIWLGAIAFAHDLTVASSDGHLRFIEGLRVEDWTAA